jgi:hypothetical protein
MRTKLLAAVASFAFVATGVAYAQEKPGHEQGAAPAGRAEMHQPAAQGGQIERQGGAMKPEGRAAADEPRNEAPEAAQSEPRANEQNKAAERPQDMQKGAQNQKGMENNRAEKGAQAQPNANEKRENARNRAEETNRTAEPANQRNGAERTGANERDRNDKRAAEGGRANGAARVRGNVHLSAEHATRVSEFLRRDARPEHVDINVRVGERISDRVVVRPLPEDVIALAPEYRGYDYFIDEDDEIVFVAPQTHEIVGMIDYEGRAASNDMTRVSSARPCPTEQ